MEYEMRISDWSSDVCSSDLGRGRQREHRAVAEDLVEDVGLLQVVEVLAPADESRRRELAPGQQGEETGRRDEGRHRLDAEAADLAQARIQFLEVGHALGQQIGGASGWAREGESVSMSGGGDCFK